MKLLFLIIFFNEKANDKVMAEERPSGIAITIIERDKIKISKIFLAIIEVGFVTSSFITIPFIILSLIL